MSKIIPLGDRILVKRRKIGDKIGDGTLHAAEETSERLTDLADVTYIPEHSFADAALLENAEEIITAQTNKAKEGDSNALNALLQFNHFLKIKSIQPGDGVMISKYVGTDFLEKGSNQVLTLVKGEDIIGVISE